MTLTAGLLGGCGAQSGSWNPVDWWHGLEGGKIAETRPPPPNADAPYPNLGTVPKKPPPPDAAAHQKIAGALVADRRNAQYEQSISPIPPAHRPVGTPAATIAQGAKPADAEQPNASLAAAKAPPPKPAALQKAPVAPVSAAPLEAPAPPAAPAAAAPAPAAAATPDAAAAADAAMPAVPEAPPPPPQLAGIATPPAVPAPTPPPVAPPPAPPAPAKINGQPIAIPFAPGSAVLPPEALVPIKALARQRGAASIAVTGFGGATSSEPSAQTAALPLALDRARAVAALLLASGVPASAIRIAAEPQGSGAAARLVN